MHVPVTAVPVAAFDGFACRQARPGRATRARR